VPRREVLPAPVLVVGAVASVQSGAAIATRLFPMVGPAGAVFLRLALSAVLVAALARPRIRSIPRRHLALGAFFGLVLAAMNLSFYLALDRVPLGVGVTVEFLGPLAVAIAGSRRALDLLWVGLAVVGVVLIAGVGGRLDIVGILLAALAGGFWAGYILLSQRVGRVLPGMTGLAIALTVGAVAVAPAGILAGGTALVRPNVLGRGAAGAVLGGALLAGAGRAPAAEGLGLLGAYVARTRDGRDLRAGVPRSAPALAGVAGRGLCDDGVHRSHDPRPEPDRTRCPAR
jgi:inner membrane transporter RhtA